MIVSRSSYRGSVVIELNNKNVIMTSSGNIWCGFSITIYINTYFDSDYGLANAINNYLRLKIRVVWKESLAYFYVFIVFIQTNRMIIYICASKIIKTGFKTGFSVQKKYFFLSIYTTDINCCYLRFLL